MHDFISKLQKFQLPILSSLHVYFDIGTALTRVGIRDKGVVLREFTYLGFNNRTKDYMFFGNEAKTILGKTPDFISIIRPMVSGIISDFDSTTAFLDQTMQKSVDPYLANKWLIKPAISAFATIPSIATEIEKRAVEESLQKTGCRTVTTLEKSIATAAGCGFDIFSHHPHFVIDLGAGLIDLAIVSGGGIVSERTLKNAGDSMNKQITNYVYVKHGIVLGDNTAEELKEQLLNFTDEEVSTSVRGKSIETGLPKSVRLKSADIREALSSSFTQIIDSTKELIEVAPPEVADEIFENGIALTGRLASVPGIDHFFSRELQVETFVAQHHLHATIHGLMELDKDPDNIRKLTGFF